MSLCESCGSDDITEGMPCPGCGRLVQMSDDEPTIRYTRKMHARVDRRTMARGDLYAGRYRVEAFAGHGGMGDVYRVFDTQEHEVKALKILNRRFARKHDGETRVRREFEILSRIKHPAVLRLDTWGVHQEDLYLVSEFVHGVTLRDSLKNNGPWPPDEAASLVAILAEALAAAHTKRVIHRDVKPHNIMINTDGEVKLLDFGIARGIGIELDSITQSGVALGTPDYMAPEQFTGDHLDGRSDIYSLGVVLFQMLTGRLPFEGESPIDVAIKQKSEPSPSVRSIRPDVPAWLDRIVLRCLEKDPANRFLYANELADELRKPHGSTKPRRKKLPSGDTMIEDDSEATDWALVLESAGERKGWSPGMALHYGERYYKLAEVVAEGKPIHWLYRFSTWPDSEIFRRVVDYEEDCFDRANSGGIVRKVRQWFDRH